MKPCREGVQVAAVVVPCCRHSHHPPTATVTAVEDGVPPAAVVIVLSRPHRCTRRHRGRGCLPLLPLSSLVSCPAVVVNIGAWWVDVAVGASPLVLVVVWSPRSSLWSWCPPWVPPARSRGHGCPCTRHHGRVVPPGGRRGCAPVIVVAMGAPARPRGRVEPPGRPRGHVVPPGCHHGHPRLPSWPCPRTRPCGPAIVVTVGALEAVGVPLVVLVAVQCRPLIFVVVWTPPGRCRGRVVPRGHWCPPPLVLVAVGALEAVSVPPLIPWCPRLAVGALRSSWWPCRGHVVPPLVTGPILGCARVVSPRSLSWSWCPPPLVLVAVGACRSSSRAWVHTCMVSALLSTPTRRLWLRWSFCGGDGGDGDEGTSGQ